jgi:hypothetical protein
MSGFLPEFVPYSIRDRNDDFLTLKLSFEEFFD